MPAPETCTFHGYTCMNIHANETKWPWTLWKLFHGYNFRAYSEDIIVLSLLQSKYRSCQGKQLVKITLKRQRLIVVKVIVALIIVFWAGILHSKSFATLETWWNAGYKHWVVLLSRQPVMERDFIQLLMKCLTFIPSVLNCWQIASIRDVYFGEAGVFPVSFYSK